MSDRTYRFLFDEKEAVYDPLTMRCHVEGTSDPFASPSTPGPDGDETIQHLGLDLAHDCNLACNYCYLKEILVREPHYMRERVAQLAVDCLFRHADPDRPITISFYGGEPLTNWQLLRRTIDYAHVRADGLAVPIAFELTTNGTLLDQAIYQALQERGVVVFVSIDGARHTHDTNRTTKRGDSTYENIARRVSGLSQLGFRTTITRESLNLSERVLNVIGMSKDVDQIQIAFAILSPHESLAISMHDRAQVKSGLVGLRRFVLDAIRSGVKTWVGPFEDVLWALTNKRALGGCAGGASFLTVTPDGDIYPCPGLVGGEEFRLGRVNEGIDSRLRDTFTETWRAPDPATWVRELTGAHCPFRSAVGEFEVGVMIKELLCEQALMAYCELSTSAPDLLEERYCGGDAPVSSTCSVHRTLRRGKA